MIHFDKLILSAMFIKNMVAYSKHPHLIVNASFYDNNLQTLKDLAKLRKCIDNVDVKHVDNRYIHIEVQTRDLHLMSGYLYKTYHRTKNSTKVTELFRLNLDTYYFRQRLASISKKERDTLYNSIGEKVSKLKFNSY